MDDAGVTIGRMTRRPARTLLPALAIAVATAALVPSSGGAVVTSSARESAVSWAIGAVGTREVGTSNCSAKINAWERAMGLKVPPCRVWCGAFVHQAFLQAGVRLSSRLIDPQRSYLDAVAGRRGLQRIDPSQIERGDIVFYKFRSGVLASHLAIARGPIRDGQLETVEGNVGNTARTEIRGARYIVLAARVKNAG
jgi:cell wall-associated NlpC family hydrolase